MSLRSCAIAVLLTPFLAGEGAAGALLPLPQGVLAGPGACGIGPAWTIRLESRSAEDSLAARVLQDEVRDSHGWTWEQVGGRARRQVVIRSEAARDAVPPLYAEQGYALSITPDSIVVSAPSHIGRYYGIRTLVQLVRDGDRIPCGSIIDHPALRWRGLSDDLSRGQMPTYADLLRTVDRLADLKANLYCLYIEDTFAFAGAPRVGAGRARLTPAELAGVVEYARRHHVTVVPIVQSLGHQHRTLSLPEYAALAECPDPMAVPWRPHTALLKMTYWLKGLASGPPDDPPVAPWSFAPTVEEARAFVRSRIDEVARAAPGPYIHVGGDEATDIGKGLSRAAVEAHGVGSVLEDYFLDLGRHVARHHHRRAMVYSDGLIAHPSALRRVARELSVMYWNYDARPDLAGLHALLDSGATDVIVSAGAWNWTSFAPNMQRAFDNTAALVGGAVPLGVSGAVVASWGDGGAESLRILNWPVIAYGADIAWSGHTTPERDFLKRYVRAAYGEDDDRLAGAHHAVGWQEFDNYGWYGKMYHREPDVRRRGGEWLDRMRELDRDISEAIAVIRQHRGHAARNRADLDAWEHVARRFAYVARRERALSRVAEIRDRGATSDEMERAATEVASLRNAGTAIRIEYERLWREANRPAHLAPNLVRLRRQETGLDRVIEELGARERATPSAGSPTGPSAAVAR